MSNKIKKQSLLGKTPQRKKTTQSSTKKTAPVSAHNVAGTGSDINAQDTKPKSRTLIITLVVLVLGFLITPKPQLITYQKLGLVTQSVYWPGIFGYGANLFDSSLQPRADLERNTIYLCQDLTQPATCQKYRVTEKSGFFAAMKKLILD
ncbi:hypothetical protein [Pseudoalteromonas sp. H105]|jgi:hypothetical protein|uniref:hypothetical protein n=1 Tax=Pseudoalteromonas sp. H105 TaxID=1348393 RepID=UPI000731F2AC|nr:hypothetical protein [Pseudoalteromonas sp. H105]KTF16302.1 hypothetical protein ATS75_07885 [Pseudoalteromonas sp. H105]